MISRNISKRIQHMTLLEWERIFKTEEDCADYIVRHRWPFGVRCPRCGSQTVQPHPRLEYRWLCNECSPPDTNYRFSPITGTIFENTDKPLRDWFRIIHRILISKNGVSALQVYRQMDVGSYKTALSMCRRVRAGLADDDFRKLMGIVEVDETVIGGKSKNMHDPQQVQGNRPK